MLVLARCVSALLAQPFRASFSLRHITYRSAADSVDRKDVHIQSNYMPISVLIVIANLVPVDIYC